MSRRNKLFTETIDYTLVEEVCDEYLSDEPVPLPFTTVLKQVKRRFAPQRKYSCESIRNAVEIYYDERFGGPTRVRNMLVACSNNSRDVSSETRQKMSQSQTGNTNRKGKYKLYK